MPAFAFRGSSSSALLGLGAPGLMELGTGASLLGTAEIDLDFLPQDFSARRGAEGPQVLVSWGNPRSADAYPYEYQLRRGARFPPLRIADGILVSSGTASAAVVVRDDGDELAAGEVHHYTLFVKDPTQSESPEGDPAWFTHPKIQVAIEAFSTGYFKQRLFDLLPGIIRTMDSRPDLGGLFGQEVLETQIASASSDRALERFNVNESQTAAQGQLQRFLKIASLPLDELRRLIDRHVPNLNPHTVRPDFLRFLSSNVGLTLNTELALRSQRLEASNVVHFYRNRGIREGLESHGRAVGGVRSATMADRRDHALLTTRGEKRFGRHHVGRDLVGTPSRDFLLTDEGEAPSALSGRPKALLMDAGRNNIPTGRVQFPFSGDTPASRPRVLYPGAFTIEMWLRVDRWPTIETSSFPLVGEEVETDVFRIGYATETKTLAGVRLRTTRHAPTGHESHEIVVVAGSVGSEEEVFLLSDVDHEIALGRDLHIAVTRSVLFHPDDSPEPDDTTWALLLNSAEVDSVDRPSGDSFDDSYDLSTDGFFVGTDTPAGEAWVMDDLRCWRVARTQAEIEAHYLGRVNEDSPNLVLLATMDRIVEEDAGPLVMDHSSVNASASYLPPPDTSPATSGTQPTWAWPAAPDPFETEHHYDEVGRRTTGLGMREAFVTGDRNHLRRSDLVVRPGRRFNYVDV
jgi:phage tail-like protein